MHIVTVDPSLRYTKADIRLWDTDFTVDQNPVAGTVAKINEVESTAQKWADEFGVAIYSLSHHGFVALAAPRGAPATKED